MKEIAEFIKGMLSSNGVQSFARSGCAFIIYFKVCESLYIVSATKIIPDIPLNWLGLITGLYGLSKGLDVINNVKGPINGTAPAANQPTN